MPPWVDRFWSKVDKRGPDECWEWQAGSSVGYGVFALKHGDMRGAHRVSFYLARGRWPKRLCCHKCDNRRCVNPAHLFEGSHADNTADMVSKGRAKGPPRKLSASDRAAIIADVERGETQRVVAARYGVHQVTVSKLVTGKTRIANLRAAESATGDLFGALQVRAGGTDLAP